jgi:hypothetical protein
LPNLSAWRGPFDVDGVELGDDGQECSFEAISMKYILDTNPARVLLGSIVNGADTDNARWNRPEGAGLKAIAEGFRHLGLSADHVINAIAWVSCPPRRGSGAKPVSVGHRPCALASHDATTSEHRLCGRWTRILQVV